MKIVDIETVVVGNPPPSYGGRYFVFVMVTTDDGIVGVGEAYSATVGPSRIADLIVDVADRHLVGHSPFDTESFFRRVYGSGFSLRPDPTVGAVASALEMACWDIVGKAVGQPIHRLLGGRVHERLRTYTYLYPDPADDVGDGSDVYNDPAAAAARAVAEVGRGFTALKFDPAGPYTVMGGHQPSLARIDQSVAMVAAIREAVGSSADLLIGTHGQFSAAGAIRYVRQLERFDPMWFEEPVPPDDVAGLARVVRGTSVPVATGERLTTAVEFDAALDAGVAIVQPNLGRAGGLLEGKKIASLAAMRGAQLAPHLYCGPIVAAANIQLAACSPNFLILEAIQDFGGFHADLLSQPIRWEDGSVVVTDEPGLGVTLDLGVARSHPYDGDRLHIEMWNDPIDVADRDDSPGR